MNQATFAEPFSDALADLEAEQTLLAELLAKPSLFEAVEGLLVPEDFSDPAHALIFETASQMGGSNLIFSQVASAIAHRPELEALGGKKYIGELCANALQILSHEATARYANYIAELSKRRQFIAVATDFATYAATPGKSVAVQIAELEAELSAIQARGATERGTLAEAMMDALGDYERAYTTGGGMQGQPIGFAGIDECLGGLERGNVYVLAARPAMGKTALANNIAFNVAASGARAIIFSLEMPAKQIAGRLVCTAAKVPQHFARRGELQPEDFHRLENARQHIANLKLEIDDTSGVTPAYVRSRCAELKAKGGLDLVVIDYLQLMEPSLEKRNSNRNSEITAISKAIKDLAKACDVPVIVLSQLNRGVETRDDKRPSLADLRESGAIEQDADVVMFLYREEYYLRKGEPDPGENPDAYDKWQAKMERAKGMAEIDVAKNRHGPDARVQLQFNGPLMLFRDAEPGY